MDAEYTKELKSGYLTETGVAKLKFIDGFPQKLAKEFNEATPGLSTKQSRSIFDTVNRLYSRLARKDVTIEEIKVELGMTKSMINDKVNKGSIPKSFLDFFSANVEAINTVEDFKVFKLHFESICNYLKDDKPKAQNNGSGHSGNGGFRGNGSGNYGNRPNNGQNNRNGYNNFRR